MSTEGFDRYFWNLSATQADGVACVVCGIDFLRRKRASVKVGRAPGTEAPVHACKGPCAAVIAEEAEAMAREMRAILGEASKVPEPAELLGSDGQFGLLMKDLRSLVGAEALLAVTDDLKQVAWLLVMVAAHGEAASTRARWLNARIDPEPERGD
ncbi:hypothetical protein [Streptomyces sp. SCSIO ZS0520]|uniref:hypothetical protein n=1 Tax=Streptomyces sp. SCSIO ZS0520 TaxID=2892996 RepID=UPI0021DB65F5|nr:hypothetical protein [Streptomyces sp. SCSIO ZS0520]